MRSLIQHSQGKVIIDLSSSATILVLIDLTQLIKTIFKVLANGTLGHLRQYHTTLLEKGTRVIRLTQYVSTYEPSRE